MNELLLALLPIALAGVYVLGGWFTERQDRGYYRHYNYCPTCKRFSKEHRA